MGTPNLKRAGWTAVAALGVLAAAGCEDDRATIFQPFGPTVFNFNLVSAGASGTLPSGNLRTTVLATPANDSTVRFVVTNLPPLAAGVYQVWLSDSALAEVQSFSGRVVMHTSTTDAAGAVVRDSTELAASGNSFNPPTRTYDSVRVEIRQSEIGRNPRAFYNAFVSLESAAAAAPSSARFMWRRTTGGTLAGSFSFGNFGNATRASDVVFVLSGSGQGGARGDEISVDVNELVRPPRGFAYEGWLIKADGSGVKVGDLATAPPERVSLRDADVTTGQPNTGPTSLFKTNVRNFSSAIGLAGDPSPYCGTPTFRLMLMPKSATALGRTFVLSGALVRDKMGCPS